MRKPKTLPSLVILIIAIALTAGQVAIAWQNGELSAILDTMESVVTLEIYRQANVDDPTDTDERSTAELAATALPTAAPSPQPPTAPTATAAPIITASAEPTAAPTATATPAATASPIITVSPKPTAAPTATPSPEPLAVPKVTPSPEPTVVPTATDLPMQTSSLTRDVSLTATSLPDGIAALLATAAPKSAAPTTASPVITASPAATASPRPTAAPVITASLPPTAAPTPERVVTVKTDGSNVRDKPSAEGKRVEKLASGTEVVILGEELNVEDGRIWYLIRTPSGNTGYISERLVSP